MKRALLLVAAAALIPGFIQARAWTLTASAEPSIALMGRVSSIAEGAMEGVLVSARKVGSTITITVVTDDRGEYRFPKAKLGPGHYSLRIRAAGYDLDSAADVTVTSSAAATADLELKPAADLASQLSNAEWLVSFPGNEQQKGSVRRCTHCHTLERIARSHHDVDKMAAVIERMASYPQLSFPLKIQKLVAGRIGGGEDSFEQRQAVYRQQAEYLTTINLNSVSHWNFPLKTFARPKGKATRVIYTEYDLPEKTRQPHDVIVDAQGVAWYASFGEQILGKLDPRSGQVTEYEVPLLKPKLPTGILGVRFDEDQNIWLGMQFQGGVAKFDRQTQKFQTWSLPSELNGDYVQVNQVSPEHHKVDGKVWLQDAGTYTVLRLDEKTGKFDVFEPFRVPRPNIYDVISDTRNNVYFTVFGRADIGRIDAKSGKIDIHPTPTKGSAPRRGAIDVLGRLWFGENSANRIGMFDTQTEHFQEWVVPTPESWPYDAVADKNGETWSGGEFADRILRLNPKSGEITEYLLPRFTNLRRVFVDNSTTPVTFWVGNNHGASIVKLEPLE
jgi:streptogramin lyase